MRRVGHNAAVGELAACEHFHVLGDDYDAARGAIAAVEFADVGVGQEGAADDDGNHAPPNLLLAHQRGGGCGLIGMHVDNLLRKEKTGKWSNRDRVLDLFQWGLSTLGKAPVRWWSLFDEIHAVPDQKHPHHEYLPTAVGAVLMLVE